MHSASPCLWQCLTVGDAVVLDGSPICAVINTPGPAIAANHADQNDEDPLQQLVFGSTPRVTNPAGVPPQIAAAVEENLMSADEPPSSNQCNNNSNSSNNSNNAGISIALSSTDDVVRDEYEQRLGEDAVPQINREFPEVVPALPLQEISNLSRIRASNRHNVRGNTPNLRVVDSNSCFAETVHHSNFNSSILIEHTHHIADPLLSL